MKINRPWTAMSVGLLAITPMFRAACGGDSVTYHDDLVYPRGDGSCATQDGLSWSKYTTLCQAANDGRYTPPVVRHYSNGDVKVISY